MSRIHAVPVTLLVGILSSASMGAMIKVGHHQLEPDTPGQEIEITVIGPGAIVGVNILAQLGDGGAALGGVDGSAPSITDIELGPGTVFAGNNTGKAVITALAQFWEIGTTTNVGSVVAEGVLAVLTIDTTGFEEGVFPLKFGDIAGFHSDFSGTPATIENGSISIVPEPVTGSLMLVLAASFLGRRRLIRGSMR